MTLRGRVLIAMLPMVLLGPVLSGVLHELGHVLVVWGFGGQVRAFQPFWFLGPPHVHFEGALDGVGHAWMAVSGVGAVVLVSWLALAWIPFSRLSPIGAVATSVLLPCLFSQLLAWVILPCLAMIGFRPRDDVLSFLAATGWHPLAVSAVSATLFGLTCVWFLRRTAFVGRLRELRAEAREGMPRVAGDDVSGEGGDRGTEVSATPGPSDPAGGTRR